MVKRCCYGTCNSDTRYPERIVNVSFHAFPKPKRHLAECLEWIKACGRPHSQLNVNNIDKHKYVCSKHFKDGHPTKEYPTPEPADGSTYRKTRRPCKRVSNENHNRLHKRQKKNIETIDTDMTSNFTSTINQEQASTSAKENDNVNMELLASAGVIHALKDENLQLKQQLAAAILQIEEHKRKEARLQLALAHRCQPKECEPFSAQTVHKSQVPNLFKYYTGLQYVTFICLLQFLIPDRQNNPIMYKGNIASCMKLCLENQLFLVLCRLRNGLHLKDLACRFQTTTQVASIIFNSWIQYMYVRLGYLSLWPHREVIISQMPAKYKEDFPTTMAIIDCTELKTQKPTSLKVQSQCYSDYKSSTTLKALIVTDPCGSVMFTSSLFSGSISDKEICKEGFFFQLLSDLVQSGYLKPGDAIMTDKGFKIEKELEALGLQLNIPPFASAASQMSTSDVALTRKIAKHRIHVERAINRVKNFKLIGRTIPVSLFGNINEIWLVCCYLTNFLETLVRD